jgi:hypothetical protein
MQSFRASAFPKPRVGAYYLQRIIRSIFCSTNYFEGRSVSKPDKHKKLVSTPDPAKSPLSNPIHASCLVVGLCLGLGRDCWSALPNLTAMIAYCMGSLGCFVHQVLHYQPLSLISTRRDSLSRATACSFATPTHVRTEAIAKGQRGLASCKSQYLTI